MEDDAHVQRTVDYAGLEKATGVKSGDVRSDIFFLGAVAYEMLTARPPLPLTRDKFARMHRSRFENIPPIKAEEVNGPVSVIRLVETMMSLNPQLHIKRPPNCWKRYGGCERNSTAPRRRPPTAARATSPPSSWSNGTRACRTPFATS